MSIVREYPSISRTSMHHGRPSNPPFAVWGPAHLAYSPSADEYFVKSTRAPFTKQEAGRPPDPQLSRIHCNAASKSQSRGEMHRPFPSSPPTPLQSPSFLSVLIHFYWKRGPELGVAVFSFSISFFVAFDPFIIIFSGPNFFFLIVEPIQTIHGN